MRIGVTGCGAMGRPMAERLIGEGFDVIGYDVRDRSEFGDFAHHMTGDPGDLGHCDAVISVVRDSVQTRDAIAAMGHLPPVLVISSTLSPGFIRELRQEIPGSTSIVDAPMSGAPHSARDGTLSFMLGGPDETIEGLMPAFRTMGGVIHRLGPLGAGASAKVLNNFVAAACVAAVRTVLDQSGPLGLDPALLRAVMDTSSGGTWYGQNLDRIDWAPQTYDPGNTIGILEKDVTAYLDAVSRDGKPDALTAAVLERLRNLPPMPET